ncbi:MAG: hypothetical protein R6X20_06700 [Phycisphaerae bacterium]
MRHLIHRPRTAWGTMTAGIILAVASCLSAADADEDAKTVAVTILGIHATNEEKPHVAPALKSIAKQLKRYKFNSFRLVVKETRSVRLGKHWELPMLEGYCRRVVPTETHEDRVKMEVAWIQYVKDKEGKRKPHVHERMVMLIGKGKYLLTAVKLKKGALVGALAVK